MEGALNLFQQLCNNEGEMEKTIICKEHQQLINEIKEVYSQLQYTEKWFQSEEDNDLIEACIYQRVVLNSKYKYLIKKAKNENIYLPPLCFALKPKWGS